MDARKTDLLLGLLTIAVILLVLAASGFAMVERGQIAPPPLAATNYLSVNEPYVLSSGGDTTWVQVHNTSAACPGDPTLGHGGEATGGPGPLETWCFEGGPGDSCGTNPPWTTDCFKHVDVRALPSQMNINYWHIDSYKTTQRAYCGSRALWCGSAALWQGQPVECGTWIDPPGYGDQWNCIAQLALPSSFSVANGCTVYFDPRYDTECKYDYFYVDYLSGTTWKTLAMFNATSNDPGGPCGGSAAPNPDYFGNTDLNRLTQCNWQERAVPGQPAYKGIITKAMLGTTVNAPKLRWRFVSDGGWSDSDGRGNTDGAAFVDNVMVYGAAGSFYAQDFETCAAFGQLPEYWTLENPAGVIDQWHITHDPDPPYEGGGDGGTRVTCVVDSSMMWRARPEKGYPSGAAWRNGWYYRLMTPRVPMVNSGALIQYDSYWCSSDVTCDYGSEWVRFYDSQYGKWCPWLDPTPIHLEGCFFWNFDRSKDVSDYMTSTADSMQFAWEVLDVSVPGDPCRGKHTSTDYQVDNVSIGFYDAAATDFGGRGIDLLHDTFLTDICGYNSFFDVYSPDTVAKYSGPGAPPLPKEDQLYLRVIDPDHLGAVAVWGSIDGGANWHSNPMTFAEAADPFDPALGGEYYGTLCPADFGLGQWARGTEVWYYVKATDVLGNFGYFPDKADPSHPGRTGTREDYLEFSILPMFPESYEGPRILLVDGHSRRVNDWAPCLSQTDQQFMLEKIYGQTLADAGYCYDKFDIGGAGSNQHIHPTTFSDYDAVVWFTGPYFANYLFDAEAQRALRDYLDGGGKVVLCGDRIAYCMAEVGEDSLGGEFLSGILGCVYQSWMPDGFTYPFAYSVAVDSIAVFGTPVAVDLDTLLVYRSCPDLKDMSYVLTNATPPPGYTAQQLMYLANPTIAQADEVIYTEASGLGQCVYVNFDLSASVSHERGYCDGNAAGPAPDFAAGTYDGRVELVRVILEDLFGLPSSSGGQAGAPEPKSPVHQWDLFQNTPNPVRASADIRYAVARAGEVKITLYSATGQMVRTLVAERKGPGEYNVAWDGTNAQGQRVSSGVYFYKMEASGYKSIKKMLVLR
ncbi:MAG: FlgD immunoglobulin-like domain containing protein [Candidatus Eisenbacteria bacterium]